ncbi:MAG: hypothetical protein IM318_06130 [Microcystis sp. M017S1]|jgi:hypothetical protein|nr:hypothetical protein [Microcystis sp. M017S1]MCA3173299.1 hypothetical protein [Burkholderiales bacterium]
MHEIKLNVRKFMKIAHWLLFLWGCLALSAISYYAFTWLQNSSMPGSNELLAGVATGFLHGLPSWLGLPVLTYLNRKEISIKQNAFFLLPLLVALSVFGFIFL